MKHPMTLSTWLVLQLFCPAGQAEQASEPPCDDGQIAQDLESKLIRKTDAALLDKITHRAFGSVAGEFMQEMEIELITSKRPAANIVYLGQQVGVALLKPMWIAAPKDTAVKTALEKEFSEQQDPRFRLTSCGVSVQYTVAALGSLLSPITVALCDRATEFRATDVCDAKTYLRATLASINLRTSTAEMRPFGIPPDSAARSNGRQAEYFGVFMIGRGGAGLLSTVYLTQDRHRQAVVIQTDATRFCKGAKEWPLCTSTRESLLRIGDEVADDVFGRQ